MVEVFKTNVQKQKQAKQLAAILGRLLPGTRINFDLDDCDRILRVEGDKLSPRDVINIVAQHGFACFVLE